MHNCAMNLPKIINIGVLLTFFGAEKILNDQDKTLESLFKTMIRGRGEEFKIGLVGCQWCVMPFRGTD